MFIVSACLANVACRYNGEAKPCAAVLGLVAAGRALPVCPEQLGGLPTPRPPAEIRAGRVVRADGTDLTAAFQRGAQEALKIAQLAGATAAILKARSPSCGVGQVYDGSFSGARVSGDGVFAALCRHQGLAVWTEEDLPPGLDQPG